MPLFSSGVNFGDDSPPSSPSSSSAPRHAKSFIKIAGNSYTVAHPDLNYERAAVLFSLAALYSSLGANESRKEGESIKRAIAAFQTSAGILHYLFTEVVPLISHFFVGMNARNADPDLKPAMLACLREAMLAQAQECFWQKAVIDRLKDGTIAKLATRVSDLYGDALDFAANGVSVPGMEGEDGIDSGCELPKVSDDEKCKVEHSHPLTTCPRAGVVESHDNQEVSLCCCRSVSEKCGRSRC